MNQTYLTSQRLTCLFEKNKTDLSLNTNPILDLPLQVKSSD